MGRNKNKKNQGMDTIQGKLTKGTKSIAMNLAFLTVFFTIFMILIVIIQYSMIRYSNKRSLCISAAEEANSIFRKIDDFVYGGDAFTDAFEYGSEFTSLYDETQSEHGVVIDRITNAKSLYDEFLTMAAMTDEITKNAEVLKASMGQFHLRHREPGKPYIPEEKKDDAEFVRVATENYERFMNSRTGHEMMKNL